MTAKIKDICCYKSYFSQLTMIYYFLCIRDSIYVQINKVKYLFNEFCLIYISIYTVKIKCKARRDCCHKYHILDDKLDSWWYYGETTYQPRRSIFLYFCCLHFGKNKWNEWITEKIVMKNNYVLVYLFLAGKINLNAKKCSFIPTGKIFPPLLAFLFFSLSFWLKPCLWIS